MIIAIALLVLACIWFIILVAALFFKGVVENG